MSMKNPFPGVNPYLNGRLQTHTGDWPEFHTLHIGDIFALMKAQLLPMGYTAGVEQSIQIKHIDTGWITRPRADITVYTPDTPRSPAGKPASDTGEVILPLVEWVNIEDVEFYQAVTIRQDAQSTPIVWLELLSPSNKLPQRGFEDYRDKRARVLAQGIVFVEIDYLHQSPPTFPALADYSRGEPGAYPFRITVIDPRPALREGEGRSRQFDLSQPIPTVALPLNGDDVLHFDFNAAYQTTFERGSYGYEIDYSQPPPDVNSYGAADQAVIHEYSTSQAG